MVFNTASEGWNPKRQTIERSEAGLPSPPAKEIECESACEFYRPCSRNRTDRRFFLQLNLIPGQLHFPAKGRYGAVPVRNSTQSPDAGDVKLCVPVFANVPMVVYAAVDGLNHRAVTCEVEI
jgi:hypothetical protein